MMPTIMESLQHLAQDWSSADAHLLVAVPGQAEGRFEVTEVVRQGTSLVLQCQPLEEATISEPEPRRDDSDRVFITDENAEPLSFHDPRRFYEDLR
jgi:hypothetical protein